VTALPRGFAPKFAHRLPSMDDDRVSRRIHDLASPECRCAALAVRITFGTNDSMTPGAHGSGSKVVPGKRRN
jgi:hypothetical protein